MLRTRVLPWLLFAGAAACVTSPSAEENHAPPPPAAEARSAEAVHARPAPRSGLEALSLELWNERAFQERFVRSYLAETDVEPDRSPAEVELLDELRGAMASGELEQAARRLERRRGPDASAALDFTLGNIRFQQERVAEAAEAYAAAVEKHPKYLSAWRNLGVIAVRQADFPLARRALTRVLELDGGDAITYGLLGFAYAHLGNSVAAESAYRMALLLEPETMDWRTGLVRSLFQQRRFGEAAAFAGSLIAEHPERSDLWLLQANAYIGSGEPGKAAENYEMIDALGASTAESLCTLGDIHVNAKHFDLAVAAYERALALEGSDPDRLLRAARTIAAQGAITQTQRLAERLERVHGPSLAAQQRKELLRLHARVAAAGGGGEEEARVLREIVALDPLDGQALLLLAQHHRHGGDAAQAIFYYERAAQLEDFEAEASRRHAQVLVEEERYEEALPLLRRAQALDPRESVVQFLEQVERLAQTRAGRARS